MEIARAKDDDESLGAMLQEAYENGQLNRRQIIETKRLVEKRQEHGPGSPNPGQINPPTASYSLVRTYQREVERQRKRVLKAELAHQRLLLVVQGLKKLLADEHFVNLLRAEGLDTLMLSKRIPEGVMSIRKYKQVVSSIHEIGLIDPLSVIQHDPAKSEFILLDGHLRVLALKDLGVHEAPSLIARDDENYTYND